MSFGASLVNNVPVVQQEIKPKSTGKKKSKKPTTKASNEYTLNSIKKKKTSLGVSSFNSTMRPMTA